jgi:hypothetical protein
LAGVDPLLVLCEGFQPTMNGFGSGFLGSEVGKVLMLLFKSSFDERLSTRCPMSFFALIALSSRRYYSNLEVIGLSPLRLIAATA